MLSRTESIPLAENYVLRCSNKAAITKVMKDSVAARRGGVVPDMMSQKGC
jgi:hypothetical protein